MKKMFIKLVCIIACMSVLAGCSSKTPEPTEEYKSSFTQEESLPDKENINSETTDENTLVFGEQTFNDSVQINQSDLGWATYDTIPNDIYLMDLAIFPCGACVQMPEWGVEVIDNVAVSIKDKNIIAISVVDLASLDSNKLYSDEVTNLILSNYGIKSLEVEQSNSEIRNGDNWTLTTGLVDGNETRPYTLAVRNDGWRCYIHFATWDINDIYTEERMNQTFTDIWETLNQFPQEGMDNTEAESIEGAPSEEG